MSSSLSTVGTLQDKSDHEFWTEMAAAIDRDMVVGSAGGRAPLFLADSENSSLCVLDNSEYDAEVTADVQEILRTQNIVVTNSCGLDVEFNLHGLGTVADVDQKSEIQGTGMARLLRFVFHAL